MAYEARLINVEEAIKQKAPKQYPKIPRWLFKFTAWLICQKEMNDTITALKDKEGVDFAEGMCKRLNVKYNLYGMENIPERDVSSLSATILLALSTESPTSTSSVTSSPSSRSSSTTC